MYHRALDQWLLAPLARWIGNADEYARDPGSLIHRKLGIQPWTPKSYAFCLGLALLYPVAIMLML